MEKKSFFLERDITEIRGLTPHSTDSQKDLVQRIRDLDPSRDALIITSSIIPLQFLRGNNGAQASRKCYKHGKILRLPQPTSLQETLDTSTIPLYLRSDAFSRLRKMKQEDIQFVSYSWRPVFGSKTKRVVPFGNLPEAARIFTYAENFSIYRQRNEQTGKWEEKNGIKTLVYADAHRVAVEGGHIITEVPSRTKKASKYMIGFLHVPYIADRPDSEKNHNLAISLSVQPAQFSVENEEDFTEPARSRTPYQTFDIQFKFLHSREHSDIFLLTRWDFGSICVQRLALCFFCKHILPEPYRLNTYI